MCTLYSFRGQKLAFSANKLVFCQHNMFLFFLQCHVWGSYIQHTSVFLSKRRRPPTRDSDPQLHRGLDLSTGGHLTDERPLPATLKRDGQRGVAERVPAYPAVRILLDRSSGFVQPPQPDRAAPIAALTRRHAAQEAALQRGRPPGRQGQLGSARRS